ncbi:unnamed protein product [Macrosiphum euphorbiae]|uniref:Uncharacterized protein n=1 Tax=Macrosiphum euphorbiae TaxID=13131 RepID=A0AAV0WVW8_9HEMI|nr:unnamed protein product [Macrosiphum euphorbiae]
MAANELASNLDETELMNVINELMEDIINTLMINLSMEETCSVDDDGRGTDVARRRLHDIVVCTDRRQGRAGRRWLCVG